MKNSSKPIFSLIILLNIVLINGCKEDEPAIPPTAVTGTVSVITANSANVDGQVTSDGNSSVTERGIVYGTTSNPTVSNNKSISGSGVGTFTSNLTNLTSATTYFVRAYATNSVGTSYGLEVSFKTLGVLGSLNTTNVTAITGVSATSGGNITDDGGADITVRGICWSTSPNPTISNSKTTDGNGKGIFSSSLSGLTNGTKYYVRAYATNSVGTSYGNEVNFITLSPPTLTTANVSLLTTLSATSGGNITDNGGADITARGVCWSTSVNPTIADNKTTNGNGNGTFNSNMTGLNSSTKYYVRAYATNSIGTAYGNEITLTTLSLVPLNGLVGWWPFNGNANDESGNGNNGVVNGASLISDRSGNSSSAYSFDGIDDIISCGNNSTLSLTSNKTLSFSFWIVNISVNRYYISMYQDGQINNYAIGGDNGKLRVTGNGNDVYDVSSMSSTNWEHFVVVYKGSAGSVDCYKNGVLVGSHSLTYSTTASSIPLVFGVISGPGKLSFQGKLDDISIYSRELTAVEIQKLYDGTGF